MKIAWILNYQNYSETIRCVKSLKESEIDQIFIVDNCSPNNSFKILKFKFKNNSSVQIIKTKKNLGFAKGNNEGLLFIENNLGLSNLNTIYIVNPDVRVNKKCISTIQNFLFNHKDSGLVTALMNGKSNNTWKEMNTIRLILFNNVLIKKIVSKSYWLGMNCNYKIDKHSYYQPVDNVLGAFFGVNQLTFKKIGYFDPDTFMYCEEDALGFRTKSKNLTNYLLSNVSFQHIGGTSTDLMNVSRLKLNDCSRLLILNKYKQIGIIPNEILKLENNLNYFILKTKNKIKSFLDV